MKKTEMDRREYRRKRKLRSQMLAYGVVFLLIAGVCIGTVAGVRHLVGQNAEQQEQQSSEQESQQEMLEDLVASEETIEVPVETVPVPELTEEEKLDLVIDEKIAGMTLQEKVAGLFFVTPEAITGVNTAIQAGDGTKAALEKYAVGGLIYFKKNMRSGEQLAEMISKSKEFSKYPLFIGVDEEGGSVSRLASAGLMEKIPSAAELAAAGDTGHVYDVGAQLAGNLADLGFNVDFAPVADLAIGSNSVMKDRAFGTEAAAAAPYVTAMLTGLQDGGVSACLKHFPGLGSTSADTHDGLVTVERSAEELRSQEFAVFQSGIEAGTDFVMVGHAYVPALDDEGYPASMSKTIITDILRGELGYDGVVITDAMNMAAISEYYSAEQAAIMALKAGCDMILMPEDFLQAYAGVVTAVSEGTISEQRVNDSLRRIYRIKLEGTVQ